MAGVFKYRGGKETNQTSESPSGSAYERGTTVEEVKFYCFALWGSPKIEEVIFFQAQKRGIFDSVSTGTYSSKADVIKVFTSARAFGKRTRFINFYVRLDVTADQILTIVPFGTRATDTVRNMEDKSDKFFQARGSLLSTDEIRGLYQESGEQKFPPEFSAIPVSEIRSLVHVQYIGADLHPGPVRVLRI